MQNLLRFAAEERLIHKAIEPEDKRTNLKPTSLKAGAQGMYERKLRCGGYGKRWLKIRKMWDNQQFSCFCGGSEVKASACNVGDLGSIPGSRRYPGEGNGNPLQYSFLENPMDGGAWWATVHGVAKSRTRLSDFTLLHFSILAWEIPWMEEPAGLQAIGSQRVGHNWAPNTWLTIGLLCWDENEN